MGKSEHEREMLLGYLMNALEDDEIAVVEMDLLLQPRLRAELAALQKELSPLTYVYESVDAPRNLAKRTCNKIWAQFDKEEHHRHFPTIVQKSPSVISPSVISMTIKDSYFEEPNTVSQHSTMNISDRSAVLEEILTVSPQAVSRQYDPMTSPEIFVSDASAQKRLVRRSPQFNSFLESSDDQNFSSATNNQLTVSNSNPSNPTTPAIQTSRNKTISSSSSGTKRKRRKRWVDITVSVAVGILIAFIAFPIINFAKNRMQHSIVKNTMQEINQSIGNYSQIHGTTGEIVSAGQGFFASPVNLTQSGWQELNSAQFPAFILSSTANQTFDIAPIESYPGVLKSVSNHGESIVSNRHGRDIILGQISPEIKPNDNSVSDFFPLDPHEFTDQTLISNVDYVIPITGGGSMIQTAYGQNVLFQNGRIFIRVLPVFTPNNKP
jgi:hypothetical protein